VSLFQASTFFELIQRRQATGVAFPEEVALRLGYVPCDAFAATVGEMPDGGYRHYLESVVREFREAQG